MQGLDDRSRLLRLFRLYICSGWNEVHQNWRKWQKQRQDCLFRRCQFYPKWWVKWGLFFLHVRHLCDCTFLMKFSFFPPAQASALSQPAPSMHTRSPQNSLIPCLWHKSEKNTFLLESRKRSLSCGCLQVWTGSRPVYWLGRFDSLHPRRLHALLLDCRHFYEKVHMREIELWVRLNPHLTVPCVFCLFKATVRPTTSTEVLPHALISPPTPEVRPRRWTRNPHQTTATPPRCNILIRMHTCEHCLPPQRSYMQRKIVALSLQQHHILLTSSRFRVLNILLFLMPWLVLYFTHFSPLLSFFSILNTGLKHPTGAFWSKF